MKPKIYTLVIPRFEDIFHSLNLNEIIEDGFQEVKSKKNIPKASNPNL